MKHIFISYADVRFQVSLERIKKQAQKIGVFDEVITYSPSDLPEYIKASPLMAFSRGGGYWIWKPYIIYNTLMKCNEGDIVYYVDSGCSLSGKSEEWKKYKEYIINYNAIFFNYRRDFKYVGWETSCTRPENNSTKILHWMKPSCISFFNNYIQDKRYLEYDKIWGGFMIIKKTDPIISVLEEWYKITLFNPELVMDPFGLELNNLPDTFNLHRHDQSILTPLIYHFKERDKLLVLPETSESSKEVAAVRADRFRQAKMPFFQYLKYLIYNLLHK